MSARAAAKGSVRSLRIRLARSLVGYPKSQRLIARGLGLRKLQSEVIRPETPEILGMVRKLSHVVVVEPLEEP